MPGQTNQLSRYGGISKAYPLTTGSVYFLVNPTEYALQDFQNRYPAGGDGAAHVFTTWAAVITAIQTNTDFDTIIVSPLFTTPPTKAQQQQLDAAGAVVWQAGQILPDGSYLAATISAFSLANTTTTNLFGVSGRVLIDTVLGEVATTIGAAAQNAKFTSLPTVGSTTDMCAVATTTGLVAGTQLYITGTLATALQTTVQSIYVKQATPLIMTAGTLQLVTSATTTGNVKVRVMYKALDPGAFVYPLL
jgi:hypothetical protein